MSADTSYIQWFRHTSPYINAHRGKTFVIGFGGEAVAHDNFHHLIHDIALLSSLGVRLVLVHGARRQINERLALKEIETPFQQGIRITDTSAMECVSDAVGALRLTIESLLSMGLPNSPMHGARIRVCGGNFVTARPMGVCDGVDFQHTGEVRRIDRLMINKLLDDGAIVLLSCLGYSPTGEVFNLTMEDVATQAAMSLKADKLVLMGQQRGWMDASGDLLRELSPQRIADNSAHFQSEKSNNGDESYRQLLAASRVCEQGVQRTHLISHQEDGALIKELFTLDGSGTLVAQGNYEHLRQAKIDDVGGILELIAPLEENGVLVRRSREHLETEISQFSVLERDGVIIGCAALYPFSEGFGAELACLATHPDYRDGARGELLLKEIETQALSMDIEFLFVLTTRAAHWFLEKGFVAADLGMLPGARKALYNYQRKSKVFRKVLSRAPKPK
ncbi:MAG: amino-acid N-acetyltransferase [Pseudomonadales bacterium]|nr:amino-acid N-acetyltransferase [Pseudomonadales bacterium]